MHRIAVLALLTGCTTTYIQPGKTEAEFQRDLYECKKTAEQRTANMGVAGNIFVMADYERECMTIERGYETQ